MDVDELAARLAKPKRTRRGGLVALCPAHDDESRSLSVDAGRDGRVLVRCFAGCTAPEIAAALGMAMRDLMGPDDTVTAELPPPARLGRTEYQIRDVDGTVRAIHVRVPSGNGHKAFLWKRPDGTDGLDGLATEDLPLYGAHRLREWSADAVLVLAEGEKAADALASAGIPALGTVTGAAGTPSPAVLASLTGRAVLLWADNDGAGREHMARIAAVLDTIAAPGIVAWPDAPPKGDAADFMATHTTEDAEALLATAHAWNPDEPAIPAPEPDAPEFTRLPPEDMTPAPVRLLSPLICDSRTMWFGPQGAGKGVLLVFAIAALADGDGAFIPGSVVERPLRVGVLDWEDNEDEIGERLHRAGVSPRSVPYLAPRGPLTNAKVLAEVRRWVDGEGVELAAIDSVIPAAGGSDAMKPEAPTAFYQSLRAIERPSLTLAHVPKDKGEAPHPFGSTYWSAPARLIWRIERPPDPVRHVVRLVNTKHSRWPFAPELLLEVTWTAAGPLRLKSALSLTMEKDAAPLIDRIAVALIVAGRPLSADEIAERTGASADTVRRTIGRNPGRVADDGARPAMYSSAERVR